MIAINLNLNFEKRKRKIIIALRTAATEGEEIGFQKGYSIILSECKEFHCDPSTIKYYIKVSECTLS